MPFHGVLLVLAILPAVLRSEKLAVLVHNGIETRGAAALGAIHLALFFALIVLIFNP